MQHRCRHADVFNLALENCLGRTQRRATLPFFNDARITGTGQRAGAEVGANVKRIAIAPSHPALRFRQCKSVNDEIFLEQIELAHDRGIGAAARKK